MTQLGTFIIVDDMPDGGKFMDTCFEYSGFDTYACCNGCGAQGHPETDVSPIRHDDCIAALETVGWSFFWITRTDTPHCWQMATCGRCTERLSERLAQFRKIGFESANLNEAA